MTKGEMHRRTRQRQVILEELKKLSSHPTAAELYLVVRRRLPSISLGTVYRNLDLFARGELVRRLAAAGGEARFDWTPKRHYHVRCTRCGRVDDVRSVPSGIDVGTVKAVEGYKIVDWCLEFIGVCPACKGRRAKE